MIHARGAGVGAGGGVPRSRPWLACAVRAGLVRPPIPQRGLGRGLSIVAGSLAPPPTLLGGTARQVARPGHPTPRTDAGGLGGFTFVAGFTFVVGSDRVDAVDRIDIAPKAAAAALQALSDLGEVDRKVLEMMVSGIRATSAYAAVLGISHPPDKLQRKAVKRHKDRLQKRLERLRDRLT